MFRMKVSQVVAATGATLLAGPEDACVSGIAIDSRKVEKGGVFVAFPGENVDGNRFAPQAVDSGAGLVVITADPADGLLESAEARGCAIVRAAGDDGERFMLALARAWRDEHPGWLVVGVTGSVGKTTTKELLYAVLSQGFRAQKTEGNLNNEIGLPLTLMRMTRDTEVLVAEMGMNHFGELSRMTAAAKPNLAVITNIGTSHIEFLGSREGICKAKLEILEGLQEGGAAVLCGDEPLLWDKRESLGCRVVTYGIENSACDLTADLHSDGTFDIVNNGLAAAHLPVGEKFTAKLSIPGKHNVLNALAAAAVGLLLGETPELIAQGLVSYQASGMRQNIYEQDGYQIYADCYNASPDAMEATLSVLGGMAGDGRRFAVLGSMLELGDYAEEGHRRVGRAAAQYADALYAYGPDAAAMVAGAKEKGMEHAYAFDEQTALVAALREDAKKGDALLFKGSRGMRMERALAMFLGEEVEA